MKSPEAAAVVGAGPCGVAAAIQLKRSGIQPLLFEKGAVGGLLHNADRVENYPGMARGIAGPALCRLLERHLHGAGISPIFEEVREITPAGGGYALRTDSGRTLRAGAVLLATGTEPRTGMLPFEEALGEGRIFYEVKDLLPRAEGRRAAILGAGDAAHDYGLNLASRNCRVVLLKRGPSHCLPLLADRVARHPGISVLEGVQVTGCRALGDGLEIVLLQEYSERVLEADFLLLACGRTPADRLLRALGSASVGAEGSPGEVKALPPGVYAGGDLVRGGFRQAGIAVGDGLAAAMAAARYIKVTHEGEQPVRSP